jgi:hypothetical protein
MEAMETLVWHMPSRKLPTLSFTNIGLGNIDRAWLPAGKGNVEALPLLGPIKGGNLLSRKYLRETAEEENWKIANLYDRAAAQIDFASRLVSSRLRAKIE